MAPRALGDSVRPRRSADASVRPLKFTVRRQLLVLRLSNKVRRSIAALVLLAFLTCAANQVFSLHLLGRLDKAALALCAILMFIVVQFLRPDMPRHRPSFSWAQFFFIAGSIIAVTAWVGWERYHAGNWDFGSEAFLIVPGTLLVFLAYRWRLLRRQLLDGSFSQDRYDADPGAYMFGPSRQIALWMAVAVISVIALVVIHVLWGH